MEKKFVNYVVISVILLFFSVLFFLFLQSKSLLFFVSKGNFLSGNVVSSFTKGEINDSLVIVNFSNFANENLSKNSDGINIKEIKEFKGFLNITYTFDPSNYIGEKQFVNIWILNESGSKIKEVSDVFQINKEGLIEREVSIDFRDNPEGNYKVYIALYSNLDSPVSVNVFLKKFSITGNSVFEQPSVKYFSYFLFVLIISVVVFLIFRNREVFKKKKSKGFE